MGKSNLKPVLVFLLVSIAGIIVYSCRKSEGPPDPNASITVERKLVISALNSFARDSIGQFSATITSPSGTVNQIATGNTIVIKDPVAGNYIIVVTKTGYNTSAPEVVNVTLPADPKASMTLVVPIFLVKLATPVAVTGTTGAVISVKTNSEVPTSAPVANATVTPGTVFTLADGTKPAMVSITATNIPTEASTAPVTNTGGGNQVVLSGSSEVVNNSVPLHQLDLQPTGLVLSIPMIIDMYIGDDYPSDMSLAEKTARQVGLTLNYVRKDGTIEEVSPDHFSADRNTVYYKISHFSTWIQLNKFAKMTMASIFYTNETQNHYSGCASSYHAIFQLVKTYSKSTRLPWLITRKSGVDLVYGTFPFTLDFPVLTGYYFSMDVTFRVENWILTDSTPGYSQTFNIQIPIQLSSVLTKFIPCHNQGGHNQGG